MIPTKDELKLLELIKKGSIEWEWTNKATQKDKDYWYGDIK